MEGPGVWKMTPALQYAFADWLVRRSLRLHFRGVYLRELTALDSARPAVVYANHHYWWDGYLLHALAREWRPRLAMVWMRELTAFPPFRALGAMPFPDDDPTARAATIRRSLEALSASPCLLFVFPEGELHEAPHLLPFGRGLSWLSERLPDVPIHPAAMRIAQGIHQRPEAQVLLGEPVERASTNAAEWTAVARDRLGQLLHQLDRLWREEPLSFRCILAGRVSVDERRCSGRRYRGPKPWQHTRRVGGSGD